MITDASIAERLEKQCQTMHARAQAWRKANPDKRPLIQWNFPRNVAVVGCISDALKRHFASANPDGLELIKALWPWDDRYEPTVLMVHTVLEYEQ